jgi:guanylate kinase
MVEELRQVIEQAQQQPEEIQRHLAAQIEEWLEERQWDVLVSSPHGQQTLARLIAEAEEEIAQGEVEEGGFAN